MAHVHNAREIQSLHQSGQVVCVSVEVIPNPWLPGPAVTSTIMCNAAIPLSGKIKHLILECFGAKRPTVAEKDRLASTPIIEIDCGAISGSECAH
jgi:hypothetical protein